MEHTTIQKILSLFNLPSKIAYRNLSSLVKEAFYLLGQTTTLSKIDQWQILSKKLNTKNKLNSLADVNHRKLLIEFMRVDSISLYNNSYFNRAKIDDQLVDYMKQIKPQLFAQTLTIVNKLKLISKNYKDKLQCKRFSQNHVDMKIMRIMEMCDSGQRSINSNLNKFKSIVEFEQDRQELIKELGKMLRNSWVIQKHKNKNLSPRNQDNQHLSEMDSQRDQEQRSQHSQSLHLSPEMKASEFGSE